ncbi:DUF721 domain-containing protein [Streptomyces sp. NPDC088341]|uniref:DUF721 domain-containing protein n=1 Tax=Streptomyces sp. NPDC088341 TaxID=3154870 RepID=UPI0034263CFC
MSTELSGIDLARQALVAVREAAKKNGAARKKPKRRTGQAIRRDSREPLGLGAAIGMMMTERGMVAPAAGGSVKAVKFGADTGRLDVAPVAPAYGTKLRWSAPKLIAAANERVPGANVRTLHVLPPAPVKTGPATAAPRPTAPLQRRTPPDGYRRALQAHRQAAPPRLADPGITEAVERQTAAMRELGRRAFPEPDPVAVRADPGPDSDSLTH